MPAGTSEVVINLGSGRPSAARVSGPHSRPLLIERAACDELLGIHFYHGGIFPFIRFPCRELHNLNVSLADIWGESSVRELLSLLYAATTIEMKFYVLE